MNLHTANARGGRARARRPRPAGADLTPCPPQFAGAERRLLRRPGRLAELTDLQRDTLAAMLRLAVQWNAPGDWFLLSVKKLMDELGRSRNAVGEYLRELCDGGWIERHRDLAGARRRGMPISSTRLTDQTLKALALARHAQSDGHAYKDFQEKSPSERNAPTAPTVDKSGEQEEPQAEQAKSPVQQQPCVIAADGSRIPHDLAPLLVAMSGRQLCSVMRVAKPLGVRLQDVAAQETPAILTARCPVGFLKHLVRSGRDWTTPRRAPEAAVVAIKSRNTLAAERQQRQAEQRERELPPPSRPPADLLAWRATHRPFASSFTAGAR